MEEEIQLIQELSIYIYIFRLWTMELGDGDVFPVVESEERKVIDEDFKTHINMGETKVQQILKHFN